jgi:dihydropteroate synthase
MGVLNVTPDSFSDGGQFFDREAAVAQGLRMAREGARIIDVGGESTRPGAQGVSEEAELARVIPVIAKVHAAETGALISIDTSKAAVAAKAIDAGASIVNDITGGRGDPAMMPLVAQRGVGFIIMHMLGTPRTMQVDPQYDDVLAEVRDFFRQQFARALDCGIDPMALAFDPGIGFGKTLAHNLELLRELPRLRVDGRPIAVGVSRKAFLGKIAGSTKIGDRTAPSVGMTALLRTRGADVIRVHDVKENASALRVAEALLVPAS